MMVPEPVPAVVCLAAGAPQLPIIRACQKRGFAVIAVDRNADATGLAVADATVVLSTWEAQPIIEALHSLQNRYRPVGIINRSSGPPVITAAILAEHYGLPGIPPAAARTTVDKGMLMQFCADRGIPAPAALVLTEQDPLPGDITFPVVVKPSTSLVGKGGVLWVAEPSVLPGALKEAFTHAIHGKVNIERAIVGKDVSLISVVRKGQLHPAVLLDEHNRFDATGRAKGRAFAVPSIFSRTRVFDRITNMAQRLISDLRLDTCPCLLSFRVDADDQPFLIEAHLDLGGDRLLDHLLPAAADFDAIAWFIDALVGDYRVPPTDFNATAVVYAAGEGPAGCRPFEIWKDKSAERLTRRLDLMGEI